MHQEELSIDELIGIVNNPKVNKLPPLVEGKSRHIQIQGCILPLKTLIFKPWSGQINKKYTKAPLLPQNSAIDAIAQQIQNNQSCVKETEEYSDLSNVANENQIGYFYKFSCGNVKLIKNLLDQNGFKDAYCNKNWTIFWSSSTIKQEIYQALLPYQKVNHFPNSFHITRKDLMNKAISKMQAKFGGSHYNFLPKSFILPQQIDLLREQLHRNNYRYIVKPHNRSQGKGIIVTNSMDIIQSKLEKYSSLIVSHYIDNPLLINSLKFDLRLYVAITSINPLRIYLYDEGLARFATQIYDSTNYNSENKKYQHLTNYSINKKNNDFTYRQSEEYFGSKWSLIAMKQFLNFNIGKVQTDQTFEKISQLIVKTILSIENTIFTSFMQNVPYINGCFQVLGFDVLIDANLKPWLIEVNLSPSLNTDTSLDLKIKGQMISDLFTMMGLVPLDERYLNNNHLKYSTNHYMKSDRITTEINSPLDKFILKEIELEQKRSNNWKRIFPELKNINKYKLFFEIDRYYNRLLREYLINNYCLHAQVVPYLQYRSFKRQRQNKWSVLQKNKQRNNLSLQKKEDKKKGKSNIRISKNNNRKQKSYLIGSFLI